VPNTKQIIYAAAVSKNSEDLPRIKFDSTDQQVSATMAKDVTQALEQLVDESRFEAIFWLLKQPGYRSHESSLIRLYALRGMDQQVSLLVKDKSEYAFLAVEGFAAGKNYCQAYEFYKKYRTSLHAILYGCFDSVPSRMINNLIEQLVYIDDDTCQKQLLNLLQIPNKNLISEQVEASVPFLQKAAANIKKALQRGYSYLEASLLFYQAGLSRSIFALCKNCETVFSNSLLLSEYSQQQSLIAVPPDIFG